MRESQAIDALGALSHELRLRIVRHLVTAGGEGASAGSIGQAIEAAPSKVSFHVAILERAQIISAEKVSRQIIYRVRFEQIGFLVDYLLSDCCGNSAEVLSCCGLVKKGARKKCC